MLFKNVFYNKHFWIKTILLQSVNEYYQNKLIEIEFYQKSVLQTISLKK